MVGSVAFFLTHKNNNLGQIQSNPDYYVGSSKSAMHCLIYQAFHKVTNELLRSAVWNKLQNLFNVNGIPNSYSSSEIPICNV